MESAESNSQMKAEGTDENVLEEVVTPLNEETIMKVCFTACIQFFFFFFFFFFVI